MPSSRGTRRAKLRRPGRSGAPAFSLGRVLMMFSQEGLGNPTQEAQANAGKLKDWIASKLPETNVSVQPVIVFLDPRPTRYH